jgi:hypothetical protein
MGENPKRFANRFILIISGHGASQGAARPPRPFPGIQLARYSDIFEVTLT